LRPPPTPLRRGRPPRPTLSPYTTLFRSRQDVLVHRFGDEHADRDGHRYLLLRPVVVQLEALLYRGPHQIRKVLGVGARRLRQQQDRKSTRLNSSHVKTSYAVFCLNKITS